MLAAAVSLIAGYQSRLAALIIFVALTSFERRNVWMTNSGDELVRILALILLLAPAGNEVSKRAVGAGCSGAGERALPGRGLGQDARPHLERAPRSRTRCGSRTSPASSSRTA